MIDGLCFAGRNPATGIEMPIDVLAADLDRRGADAAIVVPYHAIYYDRHEGEDRLIASAACLGGRVLPAAVWVGPRHAASDESTRLRGLHKRGVRVLAVLKSPGYYETSFKSLALESCLKQAAKLGWIILAGVLDGSDLMDLAMTTKGLELPILVRFMKGRAYRSAGEITALLDSSKNFMFDVSCITQSGLLKKWVATYGASRFFYASGTPENISGSGQAILESSGLAGSDLERIRHSNLAAHLGTMKKAVRSVQPAISVADAAMPKVDTHWHTGGWNLDEPGRSPILWKQSWKRWNIQKTIFSSIRALNGDLEDGNAENFKIVSGLPGAFGLVVVDPTRLELSLREIERYAGHPRMVGLKTIQDLYGFGLDHVRYAPILKSAARGNWTIMAHKPGMAAAAGRHPKVRFVAAHMTLGRSEGLAAKRNVWLDLATSHADADETRLPELIRLAGSDKILFASDAPLMDPSWTLGKLADAGIARSVLKQILYDNALNAFPQLKRNIG